MEPSRFKIVFEKVAEATAAGAPASLEQPAFVYEELDEISELRRLAVELSEPELQSITLA